jgi:hypothetical protein
MISYQRLCNAICDIDGYPNNNVSCGKGPFAYHPNYERNEKLYQLYKTYNDTAKPSSIAPNCTFFKKPVKDLTPADLYLNGIPTVK